MYRQTASSAGSARWAAKWANCGLNAHTRSAVASTIVVQNRSMASGLPSSGAGNVEGSGSRPTQSIDPDVAQAFCQAGVEPHQPSTVMAPVGQRSAASSTLVRSSSGGSSWRT